jgi:NADPH:quinone reductase-like Zn-dependent oxidoreductase
VVRPADKLRPVVGEVHVLADYPAAFAALEQRRAVGKVVRCGASEW